MTGRERVLQSVAFAPADRVAMDLGGMFSTGISCFAYPNLVAALGLPPRRPKVYDTGQMLAMPEADVLDALDIDVAVVAGRVTNAFEQPGLWRPYNFGGRLDAEVLDPAQFEAQPDGTVIQPGNGAKMPPQGYVFDTEHGGQPLALEGDVPKPDLKQVEAELEQRRWTTEAIAQTKALCKRARESTDRAIFFNGPGAGIAVAGWGGIGIFPLLCVTEPDFVHAYHDLVTRYAVENVSALLAEIHPYIDIYQCSSDDWGTQNTTIVAPGVYDDLFLPYYRRFTDAVHGAAPKVKTFLHSCGAIYDILDGVIASGFDIVNPVQWTAGGHAYQEWKAKARGRICLWGGGVDTQTTLPLGTVDDVERQVRGVTACLKEDGGYLFCAIHNILAEIEGEKVAAMYRTAAAV